jgi:hypothetical protein
MTMPQLVRRPAPRSDQHQRVEHLVIQTGGVRQCGVAALDGRGETSALRRLLSDMARHVRQAKGHMARLILCGESGHRARARVGTVLAQEPQ